MLHSCKNIFISILCVLSIDLSCKSRHHHFSSHSEVIYVCVHIPRNSFHKTLKGCSQCSALHSCSAASAACRPLNGELTYLVLGVEWNLKVLHKSPYQPSGVTNLCFMADLDHLRTMRYRMQFLLLVKVLFWLSRSTRYHSIHCYTTHSIQLLFSAPRPSSAKSATSTDESPDVGGRERGEGGRERGREAARTEWREGGRPGTERREGGREVQYHQCWNSWEQTIFLKMCEHEWNHYKDKGHEAAPSQA